MEKVVDYAERIGRLEGVMGQIKPGCSQRAHSQSPNNKRVPC